MNYEGKRALVTGARGFLGGLIANALEAKDCDVNRFRGDVRDKRSLSACIDPSLDYVFHFGCPSSQVLFKRQPRFCLETTVTSFLHLSDLCSRSGTRLVYPSTGLLSLGKDNEYARAKKVLEDLHLSSGIDALGLRIFAAYGPNERHKRDYASMPYLFARDVWNMRRPVVWGDGLQERDLIYQDDVVHAVLVLAEHASEPIIDIGSGKPVTALDTVRMAIFVFGQNNTLQPKFFPAPRGYIERTVADPRVMQSYTGLAPGSLVTLHDGMNKIRENLES